MNNKENFEKIINDNDKIFLKYKSRKKWLVVGWIISMIVATIFIACFIFFTSYYNGKSSNNKNYRFLGFIYLGICAYFGARILNIKRSRMKALENILPPNIIKNIYEDLINDKLKTEERILIEEFNSIAFKELSKNKGYNTSMFLVSNEYRISYAVSVLTKSKSKWNWNWNSRGGYGKKNGDASFNFNASLISLESNNSEKICIISNKKVESSKIDFNSESIIFNEKYFVSAFNQVKTAKILSPSVIDNYSNAVVTFPSKSKGLIIYDNSCSIEWKVKIDNKLNDCEIGNMINVNFDNASKFIETFNKKMYMDINQLYSCIVNLKLLKWIK